MADSQQKQSVDVEVFAIFNGAWRSHRFNVRPGDTIGSEVTLRAGEAEALIDLSLGYVVVDLDLPDNGCVPNHGRHFIKPPSNSDTPEAITFAGEPIDPITLLMNGPGNLIGLELASVDEQVVPPWEFSPKGHPDMDYRHWHMHVYFTDPADAC